ncbi:MAG: hypothetical protein E6K13_00940 [Methanobacteriota archaeon]|nr:MAG: hypothetical protein E6K13_00940 [Euryarchaeota archaeon]
MAEGVPAPHLFRRLFHLASPVFLVYYWIPPDLGNPQTGLTREALLLLSAGTVLAVDLGRLALRIPVFGLRKYEAGRVSAFAWGTIGLALALALFPPLLVIPAFCGMAWIDPLCAWSRRTGRYPWLPAVAYALVFAFLTGGFGGLTILKVAALTAIATPLALLAEYPDIRVVDDDFLMTMVPLIALWPLLYPILALL